MTITQLFHTLSFIAVFAVGITTCRVSPAGSSMPPASLPPPGITFAFTQTTIPTVLPTIEPTIQSPLPSLEVPPSPAPPSGEWATFVYQETGLQFSYPANWFLELDENNNAVYIYNFPVSFKGLEDEKVKIDIIGLAPKSIQPYTSLQAYLDRPEQIAYANQILSQEEFPLQAQGYVGIRQVYLGCCESVIIYLLKGDQLVNLATLNGKYVGVMEQMAKMVVIP